MTIPAGGYDGTASFPTGIQIINDRLLEGNETIIMQVNTSSGLHHQFVGNLRQYRQQSGTYTINDDDAEVRLIKNTVGSTGAFSFALTNVDTDLTSTGTNQTSASITTVTAGTPVEFDADTVTAGTQRIAVVSAGTNVTVNETLPSGWAVSGNCSRNGR